MNWQERFRVYATDPDAAWPEGRKRHARKLSAGLRRHAADHVINMAEQRAIDRPNTLFLISCGSSGSHWLSAMLSTLAGYEDCGEVYFPPSILEEIKDWPMDARSCFMDCVHLVHAPGDISLQSRLINSAHNSGWRISELFGGQKQVLLLIRNPLDILLSRSFRKSDYRKEQSPSSNDRTYLLEQVAFVKRFFTLAAKKRPDITVRYEDLRGQGLATLSGALGAMGVETSPDQIGQVLADFSVQSGTTNVYTGPPVEITDEVRELAWRELAFLRSEWGYGTEGSCPG